MREIVFDTETTGLSFAGGDRMVEIGCVELVNRVETGRTFHAYYHPERNMPAEAQAVHGISEAFLADKPVFAAAVDDLIDFLGDAPLIAHNAGFDFSFLNGELKRCGRAMINAKTRMIDTLQIARSKHPGAKHTLDALCNRFGIDRSHRIVHGALLDAQLLSQVYVELLGGRQIGLGLDPGGPGGQVTTSVVSTPRVARPTRVFTPTEGELVAHRAFLAKLTDPIWGAAASG